MTLTKRTWWNFLQGDHSTIYIIFWDIIFFQSEFLPVKAIQNRSRIQFVP